jgi:NitT/TauT family transport system substrate-binding protein
LLNDGGMIASASHDGLAASPALPRRFPPFRSACKEENVGRRMMAWVLALLGCLLLTFGCDRRDTASHTGAASPIRLTLDWKPEPEFGGFYAAQQAGQFKANGLAVELKVAGAGAPTWQLVDRGSTEFATTSADQVLIARAQGVDVVAVFAVYQTFPQGIMTHKSRGLKSIADVFNSPGILAAEDNAWLKFLLKKYPQPTVKITGYAGGVATFLARPDYAQQCFIFSEPILAKKQGAEPQTFLIAESGFNPYTTVVIAKGETVRTKPAMVKAMAAACRAGWRAYLDDPAPANAVMHQLNPDMDADTFAQGAAAQKPLIETDETKRLGLGGMTVERWRTLGNQLVEIGVIATAPPAEECFVDAAKLAAP